MGKIVKRKCIACAQEKNRDDMIKITKHFKTGEIKVSPDSRFFGRSLYICQNCDCVSGAFKKGRIFKLLKTKPDDNLKEKINTVLEG